MSDTEHQINAELIHKFRPFYDFHNHSPFENFLHFIKSPFDHHGHHAVVDTSNYTHKHLSEYSESQVVDRTVFALKKIMTFNHHFFNDEESRVLTHYPSGIINRSVLWASCGVNAAVGTIMFRNRYFSAGSAALFGGLLAAEYFIIRTPNTINNWLQGPSRRELAQRYLSVYGPQFFHDITDPRYDVEKLRHLENKLSSSQH